MTDSVKPKKRPSAPLPPKPSADAKRPQAPKESKQARGAPRLDKAALGKLIDRLEQRHQVVRSLNSELLIELVKLDPGIISGTRLQGASPAQENLEKAADAFMRQHRGDYEALEAVAAEMASALANPAVDAAFRAGGVTAKALAPRVLQAHQIVAHTRAAEVSLLWAERVLADKEDPQASPLYDAFASGDAAFVQTLLDTVIEPALPHVAAQYFAANGHDAAQAAHKVALQTTFSLAAIRMTTLVYDTANVLKAAGSSPDPVHRLGGTYRGSTPMLRVLWGPGGVYGMYGAVLELYEGRYVNAARYGAAGTVGAVTFAAGAAQATKDDPKAGGWQKKVAEKLLSGTPGEILRKATSVTPALSAASSTFALLEHSQRAESVGNNVSLVGDLAAIGGSAAALAANLTRNPVRALALSRFGVVGWYGIALIVGGELYQVGRELRARSHAASPEDDFEGLKQVLGLKKSVLPGVD